jgi:hypothetical protein
MANPSIEFDRLLDVPAYTRGQRPVINDARHGGPLHPDG